MKNSMALGGLALVMSLLIGTAGAAADQPLRDAIAQPAATVQADALADAVAFDREQWLETPALADTRTTDAFRLKCSFNSKSMFKMRRAQCRMV